MDPFFAEPVAGGNLIPELMLGMGCAFPLRLLVESASRNLAPKRDAVSGSAPGGKYIPEFAPRVGCTFPKWLQRKTRPRIRLQNGVRFPNGSQTETASQNEHSERDAFSGSGLERKARSRIQNPASARPPLPKFHLLNLAPADRMRPTAAQVLESWAAPLLGQGVNALMAVRVMLRTLLECLGKPDKRYKGRDQSN